MQAQRTRAQNEAASTRAGASRYRAIYSSLRSAIQIGRLLPGQVLLEGPIAEVFGTSRIPVRKALKLLSDEGMIRRFDGWGYLVGRPHGVFPRPVRTVIDSVLLAFPFLLLVLAIMAAFGTTLLNAMIAIGIVYTPSFARGWAREKAGSSCGTCCRTSAGR